MYLHLIHGSLDRTPQSTPQTASRPVQPTTLHGSRSVTNRHTDTQTDHVTTSRAHIYSNRRHIAALEIRTNDIMSCYFQSVIGSLICIWHTDNVQLCIYAINCRLADSSCNAALLFIYTYEVTVNNINRK